MKRFGALPHAAAALAVCCMAFPFHVLHADGRAVGAAYTTAPSMHDVALDENGTLHGELLDLQGAALAHHPVTLRDSNGVEITIMTDEQGRFRASDLRGGVYAISCANTILACRAWPQAAAPPMAKPQLLLVQDGATQRGQSKLGFNWKNPFLWGALIATAVAVPIVINALDDDDDAS